MPEPIQKINSKTKMATLQAFRFDGSRTVRITCSLEVCEGDCNPVRLHSDLSSAFQRYRLSVTCPVDKRSRLASARSVQLRYRTPQCFISSPLMVDRLSVRDTLRRKCIQVKFAVETGRYFIPRWSTSTTTVAVSDAEAAAEQSLIENYRHSQAGLSQMESAFSQLHDESK